MSQQFPSNHPLTDLDRRCSRDPYCWEASCDAPWRIPRVITLVSMEDTPPALLETYQAAWQAMNPDHEIRLLRREDLAALFPGEPMLAAAEGQGERAWIAQYLIMASIGGFVTEWCVKPLRPLPAWQGFEAVLASSSRETWPWQPQLLDAVTPDCIGGVALAGAPGSPFWQHVIQQLRQAASPGGLWDHLSPSLSPLDRFHIRVGSDFLASAYDEYRRAGRASAVLLLPERAFPSLYRTQWYGITGCGFPEGAIAAQVLRGISPQEAEMLRTKGQNGGRCACPK